MREEEELHGQGGSGVAEGGGAGLGLCQLATVGITAVVVVVVDVFHGRRVALIRKSCVHVTNTSIIFFFTSGQEVLKILFFSLISPVAEKYLKLRHMTCVMDKARQRHRNTFW